MENRPKPENLLREYHLTEERQQGRLKIFFGYAAGVGKTYAMLEAAHRALEDGMDVAAGYVEPHRRPDTEQLLEGLETIPPKELVYKGIHLQEFDLDAALQRHPQLLLVDELAHTNAQGCRHSKRYQDVEELLRAGINVYTTVNVQHIESLNDVVASITGVAVQERVPDHIFDSAAQVEVLDIEPEELMQRLRAGRIYGERQAQHALTAFFSTKNLSALREIALRRTAERLNRTAKETPGGTNAGEQILICLSPSPSNARVIRAASRMSRSVDGQFVALFVETSSFAGLSGENRRRFQQNMRLAEELGAQLATVYGDDIAVQIAEYAKLSGATRIVMGRTRHHRGFLNVNRNMVDKLTTLAPNLDIYIIPDHQPEYHPGRGIWRRAWSSIGSHTGLDLAKGMGIVALATVAGLLFYEAGIREANIIIVYLLAVLLAAVWTGDLLCSAVLSGISVITFNFFFTEPRFTLQAYDPGYPVTFAVMFLSSGLTASLVIRIKRQSQLAARKAYRTEVLLETSRKLQNAESVSRIVEVTARQVQKLLERPILFYLPAENGHLGKPVCFPLPGAVFPADGLAEDEHGVAEWVWRNNKHAGTTTNTLPGASCLYMAVRGQSKVFAVAAVYFGKAYRGMDAFEKNLLLAVLSESGLAFESRSLLETQRAIELKAQQERLRADLLRAISHDLRTPLTSISGNAALLMRAAETLEETKRAALYGDIYDDAQWLIQLVENLLSITRIENGSMQLSLQAELLDEVIREALQHLDRHADRHHIKVELEDELLMAKMDARLIVQVLVNLVNNAITYTPEGSHICIEARRLGKAVGLVVSDDGPGIDAEAVPHLFEMFYTAPGARADGHRGLGLGLALCKSIVEAHGGSIRICAHAPHGTEFHITLEGAEVTLHE